MDCENELNTLRVDAYFRFEKISEYVWTRRKSNGIC